MNHRWSAAITCHLPPAGEWDGGLGSVEVVSYVEYLVGSPLVVCTWEQCAAAWHEQRVVPDACVDLIWSGEGLSVAGPDTRARLVALVPGSRLVGVRLRPGAAGAVLGLPAFELCDTSPDAADVLGGEVAAPLLEALAAGRDPHALLCRAVARRRVREPDPLVLAAVRALGRPRARVGVVAVELGVSARQLHRRISDAVGYGPKVLARVLRFQRLQALSPAPLAELALYAGYADQAHMTAEVTELAGVSPVRFLKDRTPTAA
jgi:AraC-like DNA-binding protein